MKGSARLVVDRSGATDMYSEPPFAIRRSGDRFLVVGSAAAPVGGDELDVSIEVRDGASAHVSTAAATMLWPAPSGRFASTMSTRITVGEHSHVTWTPEPSVSVVGSHHVASVRVSLATGASCLLVDEVALGRHGEPPGFLDARLRIERDDEVVLHHAEHYGQGSAGWGSAVGTGDARHVLTAVIVGLCAAGPPRTEVSAAVSTAWLPVSDDAAVLLAVGPDRPSVIDRVRAIAPELKL